jgi:hypothetical protein
MNSAYVSIFAITLVLTSGIPLFSGPGVINNASARYAPAETQTQANANDCDTGTNCAINSPQTQGDGSASSPTNLQISNLGSQGPQIPPESDKKLQTRTVDGNRVSVPPNGNPTIATAQCGPGEVATGGGIIVDEANNIINPHFQEIGTPGSNPNTWVVSYTNFGPNVMHIQAEVICAQLVSVP